MAEQKFVDGLIAKMPRDGAPDFIVLNLSMKRAELCTWLLAQEGEWVNAQVKRSKEGKLYIAVDDWKPKPRADGEERPQRKPAPKEKAPPQDDAFEDDIPF